MELNGYSYKRFPDHKGGQVHVVTTRLGRFQGTTKDEADLAAYMAERAHQHRLEQAEAHRQMVLEEQRAALAFTDARGR
jgi:hypothetical protein